MPSSQSSHGSNGWQNPHLATPLSNHIGELSKYFDKLLDRSLFECLNELIHHDIVRQHRDTKMLDYASWKDVNSAFVKNYNEKISEMVYAEYLREALQNSAKLFLHVFKHQTVYANPESNPTGESISCSPLKFKEAPSRGRSKLAANDVCFEIKATALEGEIDPRFKGEKLPSGDSERRGTLKDLKILTLLKADRFHSESFSIGAVCFVARKNPEDDKAGSNVLLGVVRLLDKNDKSEYIYKVHGRSAGSHRNVSSEVLRFFTAHQNGIREEKRNRIYILANLRSDPESDSCTPVAEAIGLARNDGGLLPSRVLKISKENGAEFAEPKDVEAAGKLVSEHGVRLFSVEKDHRASVMLPCRYIRDLDASWCFDLSLETCLSMLNILVNVVNPATESCLKIENLSRILPLDKCLNDNESFYDLPRGTEGVLRPLGLPDGRGVIMADDCWREVQRSSIRYGLAKLHDDAISLTRNVTEDSDGKVSRFFQYIAYRARKTCELFRRVDEETSGSRLVLATSRCSSMQLLLNKMMASAGSKDFSQLMMSHYGYSMADACTSLIRMLSAGNLSEQDKISAAKTLMGCASSFGETTSTRQVLKWWQSGNSMRFGKSRSQLAACLISSARTGCEAAVAWCISQIDQSTTTTTTSRQDLFDAICTACRLKGSGIATAKVKEWLVQSTNQDVFGKTSSYFAVCMLKSAKLGSDVGVSWCISQIDQSTTTTTTSRQDLFDAICTACRLKGSGIATAKVKEWLVQSTNRRGGDDLTFGKPTSFFAACLLRSADLGCDSAVQWAISQLDQMLSEGSEASRREKERYASSILSACSLAGNALATERVIAWRDSLSSSSSSSSPPPLFLNRSRSDLTDCLLSSARNGSAISVNFAKDVILSLLSSSSSISSSSSSSISSSSISSSISSSSSSSLPPPLPDPEHDDPHQPLRRAAECLCAGMERTGSALALAFCHGNLLRHPHTGSMARAHISRTMRLHSEKDFVSLLACVKSRVEALARLIRMSRDRGVDSRHLSPLLQAWELRLRMYCEAEFVSTCGLRLGGSAAATPNPNSVESHLRSLHACLATSFQLRSRLEAAGFSTFVRAQADHLFFLDMCSPSYPVLLLANRGGDDAAANAHRRKDRTREEMLSLLEGKLRSGAVLSGGVLSAQREHEKRADSLRNCLEFARKSYHKGYDQTIRRVNDYRSISLSEYNNLLSDHLCRMYPGVSSDASRLWLLRAELQCDGFGRIWESSNNPAATAVHSEFVSKEIRVSQALGLLYKRAFVDISHGNGHDAQLYVILRFHRMFASTTCTSSSGNDPRSAARLAYWQELLLRKDDDDLYHYSLGTRAMNEKRKNHHNGDRLFRQTRYLLEMVEWLERRCLDGLHSSSSSSSPNSVLPSLYSANPLLSRAFAPAWFVQACRKRAEGCFFSGLSPRGQAEAVGRHAAQDIKYCLGKGLASNFTSRLRDHLEEVRVSPSDNELRDAFFEVELDTGQRRRQSVKSIFDGKGYDVFFRDQLEMACALHVMNDLRKKEAAAAASGGGPSSDPTTSGGGLKSGHANSGLLRPKKKHREEDSAVVLHVLRRSGCGIVLDDVERVKRLSLEEKRQRDKRIASVLFDQMTRHRKQFEIWAEETGRYVQSHFYPEGLEPNEAKLREAWSFIWDPILTKLKDIPRGTKLSIAYFAFQVDPNTIPAKWRKRHTERRKGWEWIFWQKHEFKPYTFFVNSTKMWTNFMRREDVREVLVGWHAEGRAHDE